MSYPFSADDLRHLNDTQRRLLMPPSPEDLASWVEGVCSAARRVFRTDHVYYLEPSGLFTACNDVPSTARLSSEDGHGGDGQESDGASSVHEVSPTRGPDLFVHSSAGGHDFEQGIRNHFVGFENGFSQFREDYPTLQHRLIRAAGVCAVHDEPLHDMSLREPLDLYQEVFRPVRVDRQIALSVPLPQGEAMLIAGFEHHQKPAHGGPRHQMLELLLPAFEAGIRLRQRIADVGRHLHDVLDFVDEALITFDVEGRETYRNRAFTRLVSPAGDSDSLLRAARELARGLLAPETADGLSATSRTVDVASGRYTLRARYDETPTGEAGVLVAVERASVLPSPEQVETQLGLTPREAEVALFLARGYTDQEIGERLFISVHTARRHTASVLDKLGLSSRAGVALALIGA